MGGALEYDAGGVHGCDLVDAEREAALVRRERVGQDRRRVRDQHRAAERLQQAPADQPQRPVTAVGRIERDHRT
jgi:hypothetical protein